jgi:glycosyltransferase involved in cell wall biosynthesis
MMTAPEVSIILTCYDEESIIGSSLRRVIRLMECLKKEFEIIIVNDGSRDGSRCCIADLVRKDDRLRVVENPENCGRGFSIAAGIRSSRGRIVGYIDTDLEIAPHYILPMVTAIEDGYDVATIYRLYLCRSYTVSNWCRVVLTIGYRMLVKLFLKVRLKDTETGCKFFRSERIMPLLEQAVRKRWFWDTEIMALAYYHGLRITEVPGVVVRNNSVPSNVRILRDVWRYIVHLVRFSRELGKNKRFKARHV